MNAVFRLVYPVTFAALFVAVNPAFATVQRTFVASYGGDTNPCTLLAPCRSFNAAIAQTNAGGEVVILDTAGYGPMTINKAIKIIGPSGVYGGISVLGGASGITTGITINAGDTDDVTLRGLDIGGVPGAAPLPLIGIDVQNAGAVHIEKSTISGFPEDGGACIQLVTSKIVRLYVVDSFLRHCLTGIYAAANAITASRTAIIVDNTRIERGFNANPASSALGVWAQGFVGVSLRNSMISRYTTPVQFDANLASANSTLAIIDSEITQNTNGIRFSGTAGPGNTQIRISNTDIADVTTDAVYANNSAVGREVVVSINSSRIGFTGNAVRLDNSAADTNTRLSVDMAGSQLDNVANGIDLTANNGSAIFAVLRDSTIAHSTNAVQTRGASPVSVSLIRSQINNCTTAVDHGAGVVRLDSSHIVKCLNDFVNNGSGNIRSNGQNMVDGNDDLSGLTYITPTKIPTE